MTVTNEILKSRKARLELLQSKYTNILVNDPTVMEEARARSRIDELELEIAAIDKLLETSLIPLSGGTIPGVKKTEVSTEIVFQLPRKQVSKKKRVSVKEVEGKRKKDTESPSTP